MLARLVAPYAGWIALGFVLLMIASHSYAYSLGYKAASSSYQLGALAKATTIREKQNEIRNHRPDTPALYDSLRQGTF